MTIASGLGVVCWVALLGWGCGDSGTEADRLGVGAQCTKVEDCGTGQRCLAFKGGYCGLSGCAADVDCPGGSACVRHDDGMNYCFRVCVDKAECNRNRSLENEANCSSNITFIEIANRKACVPPSGT